jgi:serine/threonine protein kinase
MGKMDIGATIGNLEIVSRIGAGGMGVVWKARHVHLTDMWRAVKTLPENFASKPELVQRFQQEARTMSTLDHPGVVRLHDFGSHEGIYYLVMDYVEGHSLGALMRRRDGSRRKYHPADAAQIVKEVCSALVYAHGKGIVHRDIKPGNVIMEAASRHAKLSDFGVAAMLEGSGHAAADTRQGGRLDLDNMQTISGGSQEQSSGSGEVVGTLDYMSPEQRTGQRVDARSDLFSVGVMFYEMLMGEMPVGRFELPGRVLSSDVYPQALDDVIEGLLKPKAAARIASAEQVISLISAIRWPALADGPGSATPIEEIEKQEHADWLERQGERRAQGFPPEAETPRGTYYDCPGCEAAVRSDWFFCVECGEKLRMDMRQCQRCKGYPPPGSGHCQFCGQQRGA